ncbi:TetR/AcrR family transcriptional regulator [Duganella sp. BJB488]|uniref:TetR family transcriptional regulator n=1 Tax=unclassified Duganella TaxID=2636909 RepID=UPI000E347935|nr:MULTISPECIES: TetR family transcriptional regulator [unclassified Duganella]NVD73084.1 TetR family transcriptional regulator [Duganella sp. BJB1802]RFP09824.1 TetR/AcrR family transcriptional regulator [Duganella sp. BJB489]RFP13317.1 TetR/AcrR family transcriptional regulator [Duganella sp. BJB488]RFP29388.1 TetR/AcrR family transcriptional regulator [Duganella sp. BJB480]
MSDALAAPAPKKRGRPQKGEGGGLRAELLEKSALLFRTKGYDNTTVREIAAAAGIQAGSWFYHFKSKQDILTAIMEQGLARSLAEIEAIASQPLPPRDLLRQLVEAHLHTLLAPDHHFIAVLLYEWRSLDQPARDRIVALKDRYEAVWDEAIAALHRSGDWAMPSQFDRLLIFGALNWTVQWYKPGSGVDVKQLAQQAMLFILRTPAALEAQ